eukprot:183086_1
MKLVKNMAITLLTLFINVPQFYAFNSKTNATSVSCEYSVYFAANDDMIYQCNSTCDSIDAHCLTNRSSSVAYYVVDSLSTSDSMQRFQNDTNEQCKRQFGTSLASLKTERDIDHIRNIMNYMNASECWIGINDTDPIFTIDGVNYYQWIDRNINTFPNMLLMNHIYSNYTDCVSITNDTVESYTCNATKLACFVCNAKDDPVLTLSDARNHIIHSKSHKSWYQADDYCFDEFGTHLSTIQMQTDLNSIQNLSNQIISILSETDWMAFDANNIELTIWNGRRISISYDECIDFWHRQFDISQADGSAPDGFNDSLVNLHNIIIETCSPTAAPTNAPTLAPTNTPSQPPTNAPTMSPTRAPTNAPTNTPTAAPTPSPTAAPTKPPTETPTASPNNYFVPTSSPIPIGMCPLGFDADIIIIVDNSCGLTRDECESQMSGVANIILTVKSHTDNPKFGLIQFTDTTDPNVIISLSDPQWNSDLNQDIYWELRAKILSTICIQRAYRTNLVSAIETAVAEFNHHSDPTRSKKLIIISNCGDKTINNVPSDDAICSQFGGIGATIDVTVINAVSTNSDFDETSYLKCIVPFYRLFVIDNVADDNQWWNVLYEILSARRRLGLCTDNVYYTREPTLYEGKPPTPPTRNPPTTNVVDPFLPTLSPIIARFENPMEPSSNPSPSPTAAPVYRSDECLVLNVYGDVNNIDETVFNWTTYGCDTAISSTWSCNMIDRAKYQVHDDKYTVLMDDMDKSEGRSWISADRYCQDVFNTSLCRVLSPYDQSDIVQLKNRMKAAYDIEFNHQIYESLWIGMRFDDENFVRSRLEWSDASTSNYSNLISGCLSIDGFNETSWTIEECNKINHHYVWCCNNYLTNRPTTSPTLTPTIFTKEKKDNRTMLETISYYTATYPFELLYILVLFVSFMVTIFAFCHTKSAYCCHEKCILTYTDDAKYICALLFGIQFWDFFSDVSFAYNLPNKSHNNIFFISVLFVVVPWSLNIIFLLLYRYQWSNNAEVSWWLRENTVKLVITTMICGSAQTVIELMNSKIFGLDLFEMGLSRMQLIGISKFRVWLCNVAQNIPQICCVLYWMMRVGHNEFAVASLISSTCSVILVVVATILIRMDHLHDEQIEFVLHYKWHGHNVPKQAKDKLNRIGFHRRIAKCIATVLELDRDCGKVHVDKHVIGIKTITINVSITHAQSFEEKTEDEEGLVSKTSIIYRIDDEQCREIMIGIVRILNIDANDIRISRMDVIPLDYEGSKLYLYTKTVFDTQQLMSGRTNVAPTLLEFAAIRNQ